MEREKHNLSENQKNEVIDKIKNGQTIPKEYLYDMAEDDEDVFLFWNGRDEEVTNAVLPFHSIEHIDEPRKEANEQKSIFDTDNRGRQKEGWTNKLIWGDNKLILSSLLNGPLRKEIEEQGGIKLIYIDPPFAVGSDFSFTVDIGEEEATKEPSVLEEVAYRDTWQRGMSSYLSMMYERLKLMHQLLSDDGSIYVHCDWRVNSHLKLVLNDIFGEHNFQNEIIWPYQTGGRPENYYSRKHDSLLFYSKSEEFIFNSEDVGPRRGDVTDHHMKEHVDDDGRKYWTIKSGEKTYKYYEDDRMTPTDVWSDISHMQQKDPQRVGYPTQKPEKLLERVIKASSNDGDIVADFFIGSGTTPVKSEKLNRKWIGADLSRFSIHTTKKRLIKTQRKLKKESKSYRSFEMLNLGKYERRHFFDINTELSEEKQQEQQETMQDQYFDLISKAYRSQRIENFENLHAKKRNKFVHIGPIDFPVTKATVENIFEECKEKEITKVDVLGFDFEMGVQPYIEQQAEEQGIRLNLKNIPREVFDKQAVEKGHVNFYDISYLDVETNKLGDNKVEIELTNFVTSYTQDDLEEVEKDLRKRSSKVVIEKGNIIKVEKDKNGVIEKEVLTKEWTDWIDYWAVDFDYESKKEIVRVGKNGESEEVWTGNYLFENEWQSFRTKQERELELTSAAHQYDSSGRYKVAVRVVDILGQDTLQVIEVEV